MSERRRHGDSPAAAASSRPVMICLLGTFRVLKAGRPVPMRSGGKHEALLLNLSIRRGYCAPREVLLEALWPDSAEPLARQSLNTLLHSLHRRLGDALRGAPPVLNAGGECRLNTEAGVCVDVARFDSLVSAAEREARSGNAAAAAGAFDAARHLYGGDLCAGEDAYAAIERERVRAAYLTSLGYVADHHYSRGDYDACLRVTLELLATDPCREDGHRTAMRCYVKRRERAQALRQYRLCEAVLRAEFDAAPEPATIALFDQIRLAPDSI